MPREDNKKADRLANLGADASERAARRQEVPARAVIALPVEDIARRRAEILAAIARAAAKSGRHADEVALMAVTKGHGPETVAPPRAPGFTLFGENRVQEGVREDRGARGPSFRASTGA